VSQGILTAVVAGLCLIVAPHLGIREAYWSAISCIIVMQSEVSATLVASRDRVIGTAIGGVLGWGCAVVWGGHIVLFGVAVAIALAACGALDLASAGRISAVTVAIITLWPHQGPAWVIALHRLLGVSFGVVVGLGAALGFAAVERAWAARRGGEAATGSTQN
jgi:uncharacterized membrane protein YgaE (UPF0421/DUF939 family)